MTCQSHSRRNSLPASLIIHCPTAGDCPDFAVTPGAKWDCPSRAPLRPRTPRGFTLIEMLVSLAITLIMMGAVVTLFGVVSESVSKSRSLIETTDRLRAAREVIQQDLQGATASLTPPLSPENDQGYFEIIEGPSSDGGAAKSPYQYYNFTLNPPNPSAGIFGDCDDALMLTVRSRSGPFLGKYSTGGASRIIESPVAEVVYFLVQDGPIIDATKTPPIKLCTLYRRVLLVSPSTPEFNLPFADFYALNDISAHHVTTPAEKLVPNTLGDLTKRENRFAHYGDLTSVNYGFFPYLVNTSMLPQVPFAAVPTGTSVPTRATYTTTAFPTNRPSIGGFLVPLDGTRLGEDVLLTNVIAFDVRIWDPQAPLGESGGVVVKPGDPGWNTGLTQVSTGAYVDLGYEATVVSPMGRVNSHQKPQSGTVYLLGSNNTDNRIYDTWSLHYENDGVDQDGDNFVDGGTNGLDDDGDGLIDDQDFDPAKDSEWDTHPPYAVPLRGVEITLRVYEPSSQQVREVVIVQNFDTKK